MLQLFREYVLEHPKQREWIKTCVQNLWEICPENPLERVASFFFSIVEMTGEMEVIFQDDWKKRSDLFVWLLPIWLEKQSLLELENFVEDEIIGEQVFLYLKERNNPLALKISEQRFLNGELSELQDILFLENADQLLEIFIQRYPLRRKQVLSQLKSIPLVWKDESGHWASWLRKLS